MEKYIDVLSKYLPSSRQTPAMSAAVYNLLAIVGASSLGYFGLKTLSTLRFFLHSSKLKRYHHGPEPYALVTGASDGIGMAYAHELAQRGFNVLLHGRNETKLKKVVEGLQAKYPKTSFKIWVLDCGEPITDEFDEKVHSAIDGINLTVVIHNVAGTGGAQVEMSMFDVMSAKQCDGWIDVNVRFITQLTRVLLPTLRQKQPALMLYMSSAVTDMTVPGLSLYTGTKGFMEHFVRCLRLELKSKGDDIEIASLTVGMVATATSGRKEEDASMTMPTPRAFVKAALNSVGYGTPRITPWYGHYLQLAMMTSMPASVQESMMLSMAKKVQEDMEKRN